MTTALLSRDLALKFPPGFTSDTFAFFLEFVGLNDHPLVSGSVFFCSDGPIANLFGEKPCDAQDFAFSNLRYVRARFEPRIWRLDTVVGEFETIFTAGILVQGEL